MSKESHDPRDETRREFLKDVAIVSAAATASSWASRAASAEAKKSPHPRATMMLIGGGGLTDPEELPDAILKKYTHDKYHCSEKELLADPARREELFDHLDPTGLLRKMIKLSPKHPPVVEVITAATIDHEKEGEEYAALFTMLGAKATYMHIEEPKHANDPELVKRMGEANIVFMGGGQQDRLAKNVMGEDRSGSLVYDELNRRIHEDPDFVIAGTSAGAMVMTGAQSPELLAAQKPQPKTVAVKTTGASSAAAQKILPEIKMINGGLADSVVSTMQKGYGFTGPVIDTHSNRTGWPLRLKTVIEHYAREGLYVLGVGINVVTGVVVKDGVAEVVASKRDDPDYERIVHVVDPTKSGQWKEQYKPGEKFTWPATELKAALATDVVLPAAGR